jgi:hypothetical protein
MSVPPREIINSPNCTINHKRAYYLLEKWCGKGWYDYGVSLDLGWLTNKGINKAKELILEEGLKWII